MSCWAKKGSVAEIKIQGKRTKRINIIAAKSNNNIIAPFVFYGGCDTKLFEKLY